MPKRKGDATDPEDLMAPAALNVYIPRYLKEFVRSLSKSYKLSMSGVLHEHLRWLWERRHFRSANLSQEDVWRDYRMKGYCIDPYLTMDQRDRLVEELNYLQRARDDKKEGICWGEVHVSKE